MVEHIPLPSSLPDTLTLAQLRDSVGAFGYKLVMTKSDPPPNPPGFSAPPKEKA